MLTDASLTTTSKIQKGLIKQADLYTKLLRYLEEEGLSVEILRL